MGRASEPPPERAVGETDEVGKREWGKQRAAGSAIGAGLGRNGRGKEEGMWGGA